MRDKLRNSSIVKSIVCASDILKCLGNGAEKLTDISNRLKLSKATAYRMLKTLESSGFLVKDPVTKRYYLGPLIVRLASSPTISHQRLIVYAFDEMKHLQDLSGETVALQIKVVAQRMILEELASNQNIRFTLGKGFVSPLHIAAGGKVLLSELPDNERQMILNGTRLVTLRTNKTIDREALEKEVKKIQEKGYAISISETIQGSAGICVPIKNYICPAALAIFGPEERFKKNMMDFLKELKESADRISSKFLE